MRGRRSDGALVGAAASKAPWSAADDATLRRTYAAGGLAAAAGALPRRTRVAIQRRAQRLGMLRQRRWGPVDNARLRQLWAAATPLEAIAAELGRSPEGVYFHAWTLGLRLGCPDGWEYLEHAAARAGYDARQLRGILAAAGADVRPALAVPARRRGRRRTRIVRPEAVTAAVVAWMGAR